MAKLIGVWKNPRNPHNRRESEPDPHLARWASLTQRASELKREIGSPRVAVLVVVEDLEGEETWSVEGAVAVPPGASLKIVAE